MWDRLGVTVRSRPPIYFIFIFATSLSLRLRPAAYPTCSEPSTYPALPAPGLCLMSSSSPSDVRKMGPASAPLSFASWYHVRLQGPFQCYMTPSRRVLVLDVHSGKKVVKPCYSMCTVYDARMALHIEGLIALCVSAVRSVHVCMSSSGSSCHFA